jgi:hypothetical protein
MSINNGPEGITVNDRLMNLQAGWFVVYKDGTLVTEDELHWNEVRKGEIKVLGIKWHDKIWTIRDKTAWVQFKRGSVAFSSTGVSYNVDCEERCIGYYEGKNKMVYRVNNRTGKMTPDVI